MDIHDSVSMIPVKVNNKNILFHDTLIVAVKNRNITLPVTVKNRNIFL